MEVALFLADVAQIADGKLNLLGAGWTFVGPGPAGMAVAGVLDIEGTDLMPQSLTLTLVDEDGNDLQIVTPQGHLTVIKVEGSVHPDPGAFETQPYVSVPLAFNFALLELPAGRTLAWKLAVGDNVWLRRFFTRPSY